MTVMDAAKACEGGHTPSASGASASQIDTETRSTSTFALQCHLKLFTSQVVYTMWTKLLRDYNLLYRTKQIKPVSMCCDAAVRLGATLRCAVLCW